MTEPGSSKADVEAEHCEGAAKKTLPKLFSPVATLGSFALDHANSPDKKGTTADVITRKQGYRDGDDE